MFIYIHFLFKKSLIFQRIDLNVSELVWKIANAWRIFLDVIVSG